MNNKNPKATSIALSFLSLFALSNYLDGNILFYALLFFAFFYLATLSLHVRNTRASKYAWGTSVCFSILYIVGYHIQRYDSLGLLLKGNYIRNLFVFIGQTILLYLVLSLVFDFFSRSKKVPVSQGLKYLQDRNARFFLLTWLFIFVCWIPYLIINLPGIISPDSFNKIQQALGDIPLDDRNPMFHTFLVGLMVKGGVVLFHSINAGVIMYSIFQMLCMSAAFAFTASYLNKLNINKLFVAFAILFYAFYPVHGTYSVTMWSDPFLNVSILLFIICLTELTINPDTFFHKSFYIFLFILSSLVMILVRNNGVYIFVLTLPFLFISVWKKKLKVALLSGFCILMVILIKGPIYQSMHAKPSPSGEYLSLALQQIGRTVNKHEAQLTANEVTLINQYFDLKRVETDYTPDCSDPVKRTFNEALFKEDKKDLFKLWWGLFTKYPLTYVESFICSGYGYWYPEVKYWILGAHVNKNYYGIHQIKLFPKTIAPSMIILGVNKLRNIPLISLFFSIGFIVWCTFLSAILCIFMRRKALLLVFVPLIALLLTAIASPVYAEFRYIYGFFTCLPLMIAIPFWLREQIKPA